MTPDTDHTGIAIIGIGCRFPGQAHSPTQFWKLLREGVNAVTDFPADRYDLPEVYDQDPSAAGKLYVRRGGTIGDASGFDAEFFGISPREARHIDPQQRMLLEVAYEALDDAGLPLESVSGKDVGVFVGISAHDYGDVQIYPGNREHITGHSNVGTANSIAANRVSFQYNLKGPSLVVDTACSSALTAVHLACQSIRSGESSLVLAGGVQLLLTPEITIGFCKASMLSPTETCRAFDAGANGYVRSEGAGMIVLKPLAAALADGDSIYAVIAASSINQDGHTNGMTVPSGVAQAAMIRSALQQAGLKAEDVDYMEAHGTGTPVGDPIEAGAIGEVLGRGRPRENPLIIGSVKTNIGHLEAASGIAGLIKAALVVRHGEIPPSLHFEAPNPAIDFDALGLRVATALQPCPQATGRATVGVNSFGFGGANAHVILRGKPASTQEEVAAPGDNRRAALLPISARSAAALVATARAYHDYLTAHPDIPLSTVCRSAALKRSHHTHRAALVVTSHEDALEALEAVMLGEHRNNIAVGRVSTEAPPRLAFLFGGMGPQWWGMGRQLRREEPVFREAIERCDAQLAPVSGWSLIELLDADESSSRVADADMSQLTNFVIQYALAELWKSWGVRPEAVLGHSAGGMAAANVAGVHTLAETLLLAFHRGRLQSTAAGMGGMLAVGLSAEDAAKAIAEVDGTGVELGANNSPKNCTLSGPSAALDALQQILEKRGVFVRNLHVTVPYHSAAEDPIREELLEVLKPLVPCRASIRLVSDHTGEWTDGTDYDAENWWKSVRNTVRFAEGMSTIIDGGYDTFVEVSPHPVLSVAIGESLAAKGRTAHVVPSIRRREDERAILLRSLGSLWTRGISVDWRAQHPQGGAAVALPTYAWQKERHWFLDGVEKSSAPRVPSAAQYVHPLLGAPVRSPVPRWESTLGQPAHRWVEDHVIQSAVIYPGAAYVEMALAIAALQAPEKLPVIRDFEFQKALFLRPGMTTVLQTVMDSGRGFTIHSTALEGDGAWLLHSRGRIELRDREETPATPVPPILARCPQPIDRDEYYADLAERGYVYGRTFSGISRIFVGENEAIGEIVSSDLGLDTGAYSFHPAVLDAAFQMIIAASLGATSDAIGKKLLFLPVGITAVTLHRRPGASFWSHARVVRRETNILVGDVDVIDEDGAVCLQVRGLRCQLIENATKEGALEGCVYDYRWEPAPALAAEPGRLAPRAALAAAGLQDAVDDWSAESGWARYYDHAEPFLNGMAAQLAADALRSLGWKPAPGEEGTLTALFAELGVEPRSQPLARSLIELLASHGVLSLEGDHWHGKLPLPAESAETLAAAGVTAEPAYATSAALLMRCGRALPGILRGDSEARAVLFNEEGMADLRRFYHESPTSTFYGKVLADAVKSPVTADGAGKAFRILEIGGGTGSSTAPLLAALRDHEVSYTFTDISPFFVAAAGREFGATPQFKAVPFDVERDPAAQGFPPQCADIIVAENVLHATAELAPVLARIRELLAPGGLLVLLEITRRPGWLNVIFGVTEGWWKFADRELRPHHAILDAPQWQTLLAAQGFNHITALSDTKHDGPSGQTVLLAHAPDVVHVEKPGEELARWLIVSDRKGVATRLVDALARRGEPRALVMTSQEMLAAGSGVNGSSGPLSGVVLLGALDAPATESPATHDLLDSQHLVCGETLSVLNALHPVGRTTPLPVIFVTAGAQSLDPWELVALPQAPLWGLARVALRERLDLRCRMIDLDSHLPDAAIENLAREMGAATAEEEVAYRGSSRWVRRLVRTQGSTASGATSSHVPSQDEAWEIKVGTPGVLASLQAQGVARPGPAANEVEIAVAATSLNFRDVMLAMGMLPTVAGETGSGLQGLGIDCSGTVVRCGSGVTGYAPGDEVVAIGPSLLASIACADAGLVARKPASLSQAEAAAFPMVFVTAWYGLIHLCRLAPGEKVLIHAGTGGVGLAAIQVARSVGAEIFATAGSPEKRAYLRSLGIEHVMDSRSLAFADQVIEITGGRGVDVVINSLAGEALTRSIDILAAYGRFIEIGKKDIYGDSKIGLLAFRKNLTLFAVDLDRMCRERPAAVGVMLREVVARFENGTYQPLPVNLFPASQAEEAMRFMAQARHMGKVVLQSADPNLRVHVASSLFRADATYLITGGLGGFGMATAQWMVREGARSLALVGRKPPGPEASTQIEALIKSGARIEYLPADVSRAEDVRRILAQVRSTMPPLRGVFHAAMVLDDAPLSEMNGERLMNALAPKMGGAWNLHVETLADELDYFVLYSSIASVLGNPKQANYCAANAFLEGLAQHRHALGLKALAINWGVLNDVGYVSLHPELESVLLARGYPSFSSDQALALLSGVLDHASAQVMISRVDWAKLGTVSPDIAASPAYSQFMKQDSPGAKEEDEKGGSLRQALAATGDVDACVEMLVPFLREKVGRAFGISPQRLDPDKSLTEMGLDSLMAVELTTVLKVELAFELAALKLLQGLTITSLARLAAQDILGDAPASGARVATVAEPAAPPSSPAQPDGDGASNGTQPRTQTQPQSQPQPQLQPEPSRATATSAAQPVPLAPVWSTTPDQVAASPPTANHGSGNSNGSGKANGTGNGSGAARDNGHGRVDYAALDYQRWTPGQSALRGLTKAVFSLGSRLDVSGEENLPSTGGCIIAANHLCLLDAPLLFTRMQRPVILLADGWLREVKVAGWVLGEIVNSIFLHGDGDEAGLEDALTVLRSGGIVALSPEGVRSPQGLTQARSGIAYLARLASVPVVPMAAWGHERLVKSWSRLRRSDVHIRIGVPLTLPSSDGSRKSLQENTDLIMRKIAELLPPEYRGVYDAPQAK